jgi:hypothetical protein
MRNIYLLLALLGLLLPYSQFVPWLITHGLDLNLFFNLLWSNAISRFFGLDVIVSAFALFYFIFSESKRLTIPKYWIAIVGTLFVGVSFGLPLFLYLRELAIHHYDANCSKNTQQI